jgi:3-oxoacyl-[acyl-carrier protein] reductase
MSDLLLELSQSPIFQKAIRQLGVPLPMPERLRRGQGPWAAQPLADAPVVVFAGGHLDAALADALTSAGAAPIVVTPSEPHAAWRQAGEAWARPPRVFGATESPPDGQRAHALVYDGTALDSPTSLRGLFDAFHPWLPTLSRGGRVLVLGRDPSDPELAPMQAATATALEGFVRSLAKEVGRRGATAHAITIQRGAESRLGPLVRFLLSDRASFLTGQPWALTAQVPAPSDVPLVQPLERRLALVTGAARGIGEAIAHSLAAEGAHVLCLDRPGEETPLARVAQAVGGEPVTLDITAGDAAKALTTALRRHGRPLDILVHNAGITRDKTLARMSHEAWDQAVAVNLGAVVTLTDALLDGGLADHARVVCLSSVSGLAGNVGQTNYSASKAGVVGYVRALAPRVAARGITVNAIAPGFIETRLTAAMPVATREVARRLSALGQGGEPRDIADLVCFLASPGASGLTGRSLRACGGMFIGA